MIKRMKAISTYSKKINVLYVEDDISIQKITSDFLSSLFDNLIVASDGKEGLQKFQDNTIDLIITDIIMPDKEGIETILDLKKEHADIKIIAVSGGGRTNAMDNLRSARLLGASLTFEKPFENKEILEAISKLIG